MNLLAIDTSSYNLSFALLNKGKVAVDFNRRMKFGASNLLPAMERYMKNASLSLKNMDAFVIGEGPGSFTGLRIAFSIVKAFSLAFRKPVIKIGSFFAMAYPFKDKYAKIAVITDARRNMIYASLFHCKNGQIKKKAKEKLTTLKEFVAVHQDYFYITYDGHLREEVLALYPKLNFYRRDVYPKAKYLLELAKTSFKKEFTSLERLKHLYLHPKTCQIRKPKEKK